MACLRGRRDDLGVVAVREHRSSPPRTGLPFADGGIEVLGRRDLKALHARSEGMLVVRLDEQVDVIVLDTQLDDAEVLAARRRQCGLADSLIDAAAAQVANGGDRPQRDVHRVAGMQERPLLVWRTRPRALRRTPGASALAATRREQLLLHRWLTKHAR